LFLFFLFNRTKLFKRSLIFILRFSRCWTTSGIYHSDSVASVEFVILLKLEMVGDVTELRSYGGDGGDGGDVGQRSKRLPEVTEVTEVTELTEF
jgi:hypothetical protein